MKPANLLVRCMAWRDGELWIAACIDFGLASQAFSYEEARSKLHDQIVSYVREAVTVDAAHADVLLARRAPLLDQVRYQFWNWVAHRPSLRSAVKKVVARVGIAVRNKFAYLEPLPLTAV